MKPAARHRRRSGSTPGSPSEDERSLANDVLDGLTKPFKELPPKHFYDARGSELFEQICELPEYYPTRDRAGRSCDARAAEIVAATGAGELVELGSGASDKARILLDAMARRRDAAPLRPARRLRERGRRTPRAQLVDEYPRAPRARRDRRLRAPSRARPARRGAPRLVAFLGGTIGNFPPGTRAAAAAPDRRPARARGPAAARHRPGQGPGGDRGGLRRLRRGHRRVQPQRAARDQPRARRRLRRPRRSTTSPSSTAGTSGSRCACARSGRARC